MDQLSLFPQQNNDTRPPESVTWNLWHGCTRVSAGCLHCYMFRRDAENGSDPTVVRKTQAFSLPVRRLRSGPHKGEYKDPAASVIYTCFSSDFFHRDADAWRPEAWDMIRARPDCTFFMITKRPERIAAHLPADWGDGWDHVTVAVTCEDQAAADRRLPLYLSLPLRRRAVMIEPMLSAVELRPFFETYRDRDGKPLVGLVSVGGESGPEARPCDYGWVLDVHDRCVEYGVAFSYHQTGAHLIKDGKAYRIPRREQHRQARRAQLDFGGAAQQARGADPGRGGGSAKK